VNDHKGHSLQMALFHIGHIPPPIGYFLQCFDTVGWVIWPVKPVPDMTYTVFSGTLNPTQSINYRLWCITTASLSSTVSYIYCHYYRARICLWPWEVLQHRLNVLPRTRTKSGGRGFCHSSPASWNRVSSDLHGVINTNIF